MLIALRGLLSADATPGRSAMSRRAAARAGGRRGPLRPLVGFGVPLLTLAFAAAAAFSTLLPLRQAAVGPDYHLQEMLRMRPIVDGQNVLFLGRDNFVSWELIGSEVFAPITNHYDVEEVPALYRATTLNAKFDWDNVPPSVMNEFNWVVTTSAAEQSQAPRGFVPRLRTGDFILWHRTTRSGSAAPCSSRSTPARRSTARTPRGEAAASGRHGDRIHRQPGDRQGLEPEPRAHPAKPAQQRLYLTPGRWDISIQYASTQALHVTASGGALAAPFDATLRTNLLFRGPVAVLPGRLLEVRRPGEVLFDVSVDDPPLIGRLLGTESKAYLDRPGRDPRRSSPRRPMRSAGLRPIRRLVRGRARALRASALAGVPAPHPQPVEPD